LIFSVLGGPRSAGFPAFSFSRKLAFVFEQLQKAGQILHGNRFCHLSFRCDEASG